MDPNLEKKADCECTEEEILERTWKDLKVLAFRQGLIISALEEKFRQEFEIEPEDIKNNETCKEYLSSSLLPSLIHGYSVGKEHAIEPEPIEINEPEKKPKKEYIPEAMYL